MAEELVGMIVEGAAKVVAQAAVEIGVEGTAEVTAEAVAKNSERKESLKYWVKLFVGLGIFAVILGCFAIFSK